MKRVEALDKWLRQQGHAVTTLSVSHSSTPGFYVAGRSHGVSSILEALAAAGQRPGGLRLQQLRVPAIGLPTPACLARALSGCHQLQQLQLDPDCGLGRMGSHDYLDRNLCMALQQLSRLTELRLYGGYDLGTSSLAQMDPLFMSLPSSLVVLDMDVRAKASLSTSSLQHLGALQHLTLPFDVSLTDANPSQVLRQLTALTYLNCQEAINNGQQLLAAAPNLVELYAFWAPGERLRGLSTHTALRSLSCVLDAADSLAGPEALAQLTQLTALKVRPWPALDNVAVIHRAAWGAALSGLTGLHSLALQPLLLDHVNLGALTALTRLEVNLKAPGGSWYGAWYQDRLLPVLGPARHRLQQVVLVGVPVAEQHVGGGAVLNPAAVAFGDTCGRRVWCVCCNGH
jgi:hypothetical protein